MIRKNVTRWMLWAFLSVVALCPSAYAVDISVNVAATIEAASLAGTADQALDFGTVISSGSSAAVTVDASGGAATPSVTTGTASVSGGNSGRISVTTTLAANVTIAYPSSVTITRTSGGSETMTVNNIAANSTASPLAATVAGPNQIHIGGVLAIGAAQAAASYAGTMTVTINYE